MAGTSQGALSCACPPSSLAASWAPAPAHRLLTRAAPYPPRLRRLPLRRAAAATLRAKPPHRRRLPQPSAASQVRPSPRVPPPDRATHRPNGWTGMHLEVEEGKAVLQFSPQRKRISL